MVIDGGTLELAGPKPHPAHYEPGVRENMTRIGEVAASLRG